MAMAISPFIFIGRKSRVDAKRWKTLFGAEFKAARNINYFKAKRSQSDRVVDQPLQNP